jgi:hypothetical protein
MKNWMVPSWLTLTAVGKTRKLATALVQIRYTILKM